MRKDLTGSIYEIFKKIMEYSRNQVVQRLSDVSAAPMTGGARSFFQTSTGEQAGALFTAKDQPMI